MGGGQHESIANQRAAAEPFNSVPLRAEVSEPSHMRKLLGISGLPTDYQGRIAEAVVNCLVHDGRIGKQKAIANLLLKDGLLVADAGCRWKRRWYD